MHGRWEWRHGRGQSAKADFVPFQRRISNPPDSNSPDLDPSGL